MEIFTSTETIMDWISNKDRIKFQNKKRSRSSIDLNTKVPSSDLIQMVLCSGMSSGVEVPVWHPHIYSARPSQPTPFYIR